MHASGGRLQAAGAEELVFAYLAYKRHVSRQEYADPVAAYGRLREREA